MIRYTRHTAIAALAILIAIAVWSLAHRASGGPSLERMSDTKYWVERIGTLGSSNAYEEMVGVALKHPTTEQHIISHTFGGALYEATGIVGLAVCDSRPTYGCYHEVVKRYMDEDGDADLQSLASLCDTTMGDRAWLCKHGVGHGLMLRNGRTIEGLKKSLAQCDVISKPTQWESCHAGAFMEYDFDMGQPGSLGAPRPLDVSGYFSPCSNVAEPYYVQCMRRRPHWWMVILPESSLNDKLSRMMSMCREIQVTNADGYQACVAGVGLHAAFLANGDLAAARRFCAHASESNEENIECTDEALRAFKVLSQPEMP